MAYCFLTSPHQGIPNTATFQTPAEHTGNIILRLLCSSRFRAFAKSVRREHLVAYAVAFARKMEADPNFWRYPMARWQSAGPIYEAASLFRKRCLVDGTSLLWPGVQAWTVENLTLLWEAFIGNADTGDRSFFEKWHDQLANSSMDVHRVAADVIAFHHLFSSTITPAKRLEDVENVISWKLSSERPDLGFLKRAYESRLADAGADYQLGRPWQIAFYLEFARVVRSQGVDPNNLQACRRIADEVRDRVPNSGSARHILLHLLFPDQFERIASDRHKRWIVRTFADLTAGASDVDDALANIRVKLAQQRGRSIDFYEDDLERQWQKKAADANEPTEDSEVEPSPQPGTYTLEQCAEDTGVAPKTITSWLQTAHRKKHIVLQGPPGTGKTFIAQRLARLLTAGTTGLIDKVQFHPAYAYEDFIQGIRPQLGGRTLSYELHDGRFVAFCKRAAKVDPAPCVLIIDELNRANLSRVFGELIYLLEYRSEDMPLAGGEKFQIPPNVYLIGTMNTADRSIALVDHALRRRFAFIRLDPQYNVLMAFLAKYGMAAAPLVDVLRRVNAAIEDPNYAVGISFFMRADLKTTLPDIWSHEIEPYLEEFFFDNRLKAEQFRWDLLAAKELKDWTS
jgi:hypothetical protein